jgi:glucose dehydrogenase
MIPLASKDHLYTASILAVNADTGTLKWHFQLVPGEMWDDDGVQQLPRGSSCRGIRSPE